MRPSRQHNLAISDRIASFTFVIAAALLALIMILEAISRVTN